MKHIILLSISAAMLIIAGCNKDADINKDVPGDQQTKVDVSGNSCYYILKSTGGVPSSSESIYSDIAELKPYSAHILLNDKEEGLADIIVEYEFRTIFNETEYGHPTLSLCFDNINITREDGIVLIDNTDVSGICKTDNQIADYTDVSIKGILMEQDSNLYIEGRINGLPFALNIISATTTAEDFKPVFLDLALVDFVPYLELEVTNRSGLDVNVIIEDGRMDAHFHLEPDQTQLIRSYFDNFPFGSVIEITYGSGDRIVVYGSDHESEPSCCFQQTAHDFGWFLIYSGTGAIIPFGFSRDSYIINPLPTNS